MSLEFSLPTVTYGIGILPLRASILFIGTSALYASRFLSGIVHSYLGRAMKLFDATVLSHDLHVHKRHAVKIQRNFLAITF
jgi:hypothetical protein